jgi:hypothetical protein
MHVQSSLLGPFPISTRNDGPARVPVILMARTVPAPSRSNESVTPCTILASCTGLLLRMGRAAGQARHPGKARGGWNNLLDRLTLANTAYLSS